MVVRGPENPVVQKTIVLLEKAGRKNKAAVWKKMAEMIKAGRRRRREVNVRKLAAYAGQTVVVPGKVLGIGTTWLEKPVTVAALAFSASARAAIEKTGGKAITVKELVEANPKGSGIRILG